MNVKNLMYEMKRNIIYTLTIIGIYFVIFIAVTKLEKEFNIILFDMLMINGVFFGSLIQVQLEEHMNFGFCRKSILKNQLILGLTNAVCISLVKTYIQVAFYNDFVQMFMEGTDHTLSMYHRVPAIELFIVNVMIFMILYMVTIILATSCRKILSHQPSNTPQLRFRADNEKKLNIILKTIIFLVAIIVVVTVTMGISAYYWFQMLYQPVYRLLAALGIAAVLAGMCYIAKRRYSPRYI